MDTRQQKNPTVSTDDWYTPKWIIDTLGPFDLDPCAPPFEVRPYEIAPTAYTKDDDGLAQGWRMGTRLMYVVIAAIIFVVWLVFNSPLRITTT